MKFSFDNDASTELSGEILQEKYRLLGEYKTPRVILLSEECFDLLRDAWIKDVSELPWGDSLISDLKAREDKFQVFLSDGTLHGLWVIKVNTIEKFMVY